MKILMVNKFLYPNGGSETYMFKLGEYLTKLNHEVQYFGMEHEDRCVGNSANAYTENMDFHNSGALKKLKMSLKTIYSSEAREKIKLVLDSFQPDIVHLNNINFQLTPSIIYEIKKKNIPIVQTVHDVQIACPNHRMYIEHREEICKLCLNGKYTNCIKNKCLQNSTLKSAIAAAESYYYHKRDTYNLVDCYICPSSFMANAITKGGVSPEKITVMHNYCKTPNFNAIEKNDERYVLYFGRLSVEKGIKTFLECCRKMPDIKFVVAGGGPLSDLCNGIDNVKNVGFKSGDELNNLIANADFTIYPSEWYENCPMSILESLSFGTPVIASDLGGSEELVKDNVTGLIFKAGDVDSLKNAVEKLYNNEELIRQMSENALRSSTNTLENYSRKLLDIYKKLTEVK